MGRGIMEGIFLSLQDRHTLQLRRFYFLQERYLCPGCLIPGRWGFLQVQGQYKDKLMWELTGTFPSEELLMAQCLQSNTLSSSAFVSFFFSAFIFPCFFFFYSSILFF